MHRVEKERELDLMEGKRELDLEEGVGSRRGGEGV